MNYLKLFWPSPSIFTKGKQKKSLKLEIQFSRGIPQSPETPNDSILLANAPLRYTRDKTPVRFSASGGVVFSWSFRVRYFFVSLLSLSIDMERVKRRFHDGGGKNHSLTVRVQAVPLYQTWIQDTSEGENTHIDNRTLLIQTTKNMFRRFFGSRASPISATAALTSLTISSKPAVTTSAGAMRKASFAGAIASTRPLFSSSAVATTTGSSTSPAAINNATDSVIGAPLTAAQQQQQGQMLAATELAKRVNAMKRAHQGAVADERKKIESAVWADLNTLTQEQCAAADGQSVALLLNAWAYFAKFWERGRDGPGF